MMARQGDIRSRLMATFKEEAAEHLQTISAHLLAVDRGLPPAELPGAVEAIFRAVHTLKGAARSVGLRDVEALCQDVESVLSRIKGGQQSLTADVLSRVQGVMDGVARLLAEAPAAVAGGDGPGSPGAPKGASSPEPPRVAVPPTAFPASSSAPPPLPARSVGDTIRISTARLDAIHSRAEGLLAVKLSADERVQGARRLADVLVRCREQLSRGRVTRAVHKDERNRVSLREGLDAEIRAAEVEARTLLDRLLGDRRLIGSAVDGLQEEARQIRMMPASSVLESFPRMVGELARTRGKEADFVVLGADQEVDRRVLEAIKDPLIHLVRNALDHGIELPEVRRQAGKPPRGRIGVTFAPQEGRRVGVRVEDDGVGIDVARVRAGAVRARLMSLEEAEALSDSAALDLIFSSGVSTSAVVTDLSGHGLGMAIVRDAVERLGGQILVETQPGRGTSVLMLLPATVVTFRGLLVRAGQQAFLLPLEALERAVSVAPGDLESVGGRTAMRSNGGALFVTPLSELLGLAPGTEAAKSDAKRPCVVLRSGTDRAALLVDEVVGESEVLVKELRPPLTRVRHVAGAGVLGNGELALILRPLDLLRSQQEGLPSRRSPDATELATPAVILVVDDSITTRTMERNLLEAAGYKVAVASNGLEAWTILKSEHFDLLVSDVDMPRLNGFDLTARIRADPKLADLPVVLVTALESRDDKERGIEVGANAYVIKSGFDQSKLLEIIRRLV
jgi:two-component system chemotaxis sensor kinase CheA